jgi:hypothetical protein
VVVDRTGGLALATRWAANGRIVQSAPDLTRSFLRNQADDIAAMHMFASVSFRLLYVMIILPHDRRLVIAPSDRRALLGDGPAVSVARPRCFVRLRI